MQGMSVWSGNMFQDKLMGVNDTDSGLKTDLVINHTRSDNY